MTAPERYRIGPWIITRNLPPGSGAIDTWEFVHEQYDGPGDGSPEERDPRCGFGRTLEDVLRSIEVTEEVASPGPCVVRQAAPPPEPEGGYVWAECANCRSPGPVDEDGQCWTCSQAASPEPWERAARP